MTGRRVGRHGSRAVPGVRVSRVGAVVVGSVQPLCHGARAHTHLAHARRVTRRPWRRVGRRGGDAEGTQVARGALLLLLEEMDQVVIVLLKQVLVMPLVNL